MVVPPIPTLTPPQPAANPSSRPAAPERPPSRRAARLLRRKRLWVGLLAASLLLGGVGVNLRQRSASQASRLADYTVVARSGDLPGVVTASGELEAEQRVNVSPKRQGVLMELLVNEGDAVRRGQPLAHMDSDDLRERLAELQAQLTSAEAQLNRSRRELDRNRRLFAQNAISQNDYDRVLSAYEVDRAAVQAARQRLAARQVEKADLVIRAPFDGVVTQRFADPGAFVTPTTTAAAVAGATSSSIVELAQGLEVVAKVPESDIGRISLGQSAEVRVDAFPDRRFPARVKRITPRAVKVNNVTSFDVVLEFTGAQSLLRIGMTADIDFQTGRVRADTLIPTVAVVTEDGRPGVLLVGRDNQPTFQPVELGVSGGKDTQILSGLRAGTRVFIDLPPWSKRKRS